MPDHFNDKLIFLCKLIQDRARVRCFTMMVMENLGEPSEKMVATLDTQGVKLKNCDITMTKG